jgi:hypothetical protein
MITIATKDLQKFQRAIGHIKGAVPKALSAAMNRAIRSGRTELSKHTRAAWTLKQKDLYATLTIKNASAGNLAASIESKHSGMLKLYQFNVRPKGVQRRRDKRTLHATVRTGGGGTLGRAFIAQMKSGHVGAFARKTNKRNPLKELHTISAPIMISQPEVGEPTHKAIVETYQKRSDHEIGRVLAAANK